MSSACTYTKKSKDRGTDGAQKKSEGDRSRDVRVGSVIVRRKLGGLDTQSVEIECIGLFIASQHLLHVVQCRNMPYRPRGKADNEEKPCSR